MQTIQQTSILLAPGMYILRHTGRGGPLSIGRGAAAPERHCGILQQLSTPGTHGAVLRGVQDCIVLQVLEAPVELLVSAYGPEFAELRLETIDLAPPRPALSVPPQGVSLIGYVQGEGERLASGGALLGNTGDGVRLEGLQVEWPDRPAGVELIYRLTVDGLGATPPARCGQFLGTRGQGYAVTALSIALDGADAAHWQLAGWAYFAGGYMLPVTSGAVLSGPGGSEALTGLGFTVQPAAPASAKPKSAKAAPKAPAKAARKPRKGKR